MKIDFQKTSTLLLPLIFLSILTRALGLLTPTLWFDEGVVATMSLRAMKGDFPLFFYSQRFMGSLEAYLNAVIFHLFQPSVFALKLLPVVLSLIFLFFIFVLTKRLLGNKVAFIAGLLIALPSSELMRWGYEARSHYNFTLIFGTFLFILTQQIIYSKTSDRKKSFLWALWGLVAGLGWWTNYLIAVCILPAAFFLFLHRKKILFSRDFIYTALLFFAGSLPVWVFNFLNAQSLVGNFYWGDLSDIPDYFKGLFTGALPILFGFRNGSSGPKDFGPIIPFLKDGSYLGWIFLVGGIYAGSIIAFVLKYHEGIKSILFKFQLKNTQGGELLLLLFAFNIIINLATGYGNQLVFDSRYLLPSLTCLPIFLASFLGDVEKKSRILALFGLVLLLSFNVCQNIRHNHWTVLDAAHLKNYEAKEQQKIRMQDFLIKNGFNYIYGDRLGISEKQLVLTSNEALVFSHIYQEGCLKYANWVDGSQRASFMFAGENRLFEENLKAIGGTYRKVNTPDGYIIYTDFNPPGPYRTIPRDLWTATSDVQPSEAKKAFDGDMATAWSTLTSQKKGTYFLLDLGRTETVGKISYLSAIYYQTPLGYQVAVSPDGKSWQTVAEVKEYEGPIFWSGPHPMLKVRHSRLETVFPPQPCRFIKIIALKDSEDAVWSISELFLFGPEEKMGAEKKILPSQSDLDSLLAFFKGEKINFVYADHWLSAVIRVKSDWKIQTMVSNFFTGENGQNEPPTESLERAHLNRDVALVVREKDSDLEKILVESKQDYHTKAIGSFVVYYNFSSPAKPSPLPIRNWSASSNANPQDAGKAIDGKPRTRWSSGKPQEPGMYYQIDLKKVQSVRGCTLDLGKSIKDYPRSLRLFSSLDGNSWQEIRTTAESGLYWTGETLLKMTGTRFFFSPVQLRYLRLLQDGRDPVYFWSIHEVELF